MHSLRRSTYGDSSLAHHNASTGNHAARTPPPIYHTLLGAPLLRPKTQIFADSPLSLGNSSIGRAQIVAENRRYRRLGSVTLGLSPLARPYKISSSKTKNQTKSETTNSESAPIQRVQVSPSCCHFSAGPLCTKAKEFHCPQGGSEGLQAEKRHLFDTLYCCAWMVTAEVCHVRAGAKGSCQGTPRYTKSSKSHDFIAIAICDLNRESQITSDLRQCDPSQKSSLC